ncbi:MAG: CDP-glucose 4,6-dehydratase [Gammaproteobacteria bacterium]|nr:CDP-glucose 4,6-dehydratase [Gammaproteobacteria bacterium]
MNWLASQLRGKKVLLTGHTGFKGSWLSLWLRDLGAEVYGVALPAITRPCHIDLLVDPVPGVMLDINDALKLSQHIQAFAPDLVLHLAAQALVRQSYDDPMQTWNTNVMGTVNVLEACRATPSVKAIIVVTTDKVYENIGQQHGYSETDALGGHDPYSASKAACELVVQSYRRSFFADKGVLLATVRAGNVIGGGDWSCDRLIPDVIRASQQGCALRVRYPHAIRPWQHVLDALSGYLLLAARLLAGQRDCADAWNFGPSAAATQNVETVLRQMKTFWPHLNWLQDNSNFAAEAQVLTLDSTKAATALLWKPVWDFETTAAKTAEWYQFFYEQQKTISIEQLHQYCLDAKKEGLPWAIS